MAVANGFERLLDAYVFRGRRPRETEGNDITQGWEEWRNTRSIPVSEDVNSSGVAEVVKN